MSAVRDARRGHFWMNDEIMDEYAKDLGVYGFAVYAMLCRRANKDGESHPSIQRIAEDLGISDRQAKRELKKLRDMGLISIQQRSEQNQPSIYTILELPGRADRPQDSESPGDSESPDPRTVSHPKEYTEEGSIEANASSGIGKTPDSAGVVIGLEKHITDKLFTSLDKAGYTLDNSDYGYHLGRAKTMLEKMNPTDDELDWLPAQAVAHFEIHAKTDAMSALRYMRQQKARKERLAADRDSPERPSYYEQQSTSASLDKPRSAIWYASTHEADYEMVAQWIKEGLGHSQIEKRLAKLSSEASSGAGVA